MALLPLKIFPDPVLKKIAKEVEKVDSALQKLMDDMAQTMYDQKGLGLAANQVGVLKRVLVMDTTYDSPRYCSDHGCNEDHQSPEDKNTIFMVNPKIIKSSKETSKYPEGCLSFPELRAIVKRPKSVTVEYLDYHGKKQTINAEDLQATCVQHEIDHLDGITFVDHLSKIKREMLLKKLNKNLNY
jgi:peptide deformylase